MKKGFAFVTGVPTDSAEATKKLLEKIAFIRETHYGGFYDFVPDLAHADTAYTTQALAAQYAIWFSFVLPMVLSVKDASLVVSTLYLKPPSTREARSR